MEAADITSDFETPRHYQIRVVFGEEYRVDMIVNFQGDTSCIQIRMDGGLVSSGCRA